MRNQLVKNIVKAVFGEEASEDDEILSLYYGAMFEVYVDLIKFTAEDVSGSKMSDEDAESILYDFNQELKSED